MAGVAGRLGVWTTALQWPESLEDTRRAARVLDEFGFGTIWIAIAQGDLGLQEAVLAATERLTVATGILEVWTTPAPVVAASHQRVTRAHAGRFVLGLGSSHAPMVEAQTDQRYVRPLTKLRTFLDELDAVDPPVPVAERVLAALGPRALVLAGERAGGAHPYLVTPEHTETARQLLGEGPVLAPEQKVVLSTDAEKARHIARLSVAEYLGLPNYINNLRRMGFDDEDLSDGGSNRLVDSLVAWGDLDRVKRRIDAHLDAGADHVAIQVIPGDDATVLPLPALKELAALLPSYAETS
jgi:probable F420-dependent oxidoreductase